MKSVEPAQYNNFFIQLQKNCIKSYFPNLALILLYNFFKCGFAFNNLWNSSVLADFFFRELRTEADASSNTK